MGRVPHYSRALARGESARRSEPPSQRTPSVDLTQLLQTERELELQERALRLQGGRTSGSASPCPLQSLAPVLATIIAFVLGVSAGANQQGHTPPRMTPPSCAPPSHDGRHRPERPHLRLPLPCAR
jgi:hypothetical protein